MLPIVSCSSLVLTITVFILYFHKNGVSATVVLEINFGNNGTGSGVSSSNTNEAEAIALDTTGNFLPIPSLVSKISKELGIIRAQFPNMKNIVYSGKFVPGQLMVQEITRKQLKAIDTSEFGPLVKYNVFQSKRLASLEFKMPYNPYQLGVIVKTRFGVENSPIVLPSFSSSISYEPSSSSKYTFKNGSGNCFVKEGCPEWHSWNYFVSENGTVSIALDMHSD